MWTMATTEKVIRLRGTVPPDLFRVRLAIIRALMNWSYRDAGYAAGVSGEAWRLWEIGERDCSRQDSVALNLSQATPFDRRWILAGGPLEEVDPDDPRGKGLVPAAGFEPAAFCSEGKSVAGITLLPPLAA